MKNYMEDRFEEYLDIIREKYAEIGIEIDAAELALFKLGFKYGASAMADKIQPTLTDLEFRIAEIVT